MRAGAPVVRIAHAYGNSRASLERALASDVDMIEVDMWYMGGDVHIRHEKRLNPLPLLYDRVMKGHALGPLAVRFGKYFVRPDVHTLRFDELLEKVAGRKRLLLDVKGRSGAPYARKFTKTLVRKIRAHCAEPWVAVCGQAYPVINAVREAAPHLEVRYSIEKEYQWEAFLRKMRGDPPALGVCIAYGFIDAEKARVMEEAGVNVYCWTVDDWDAAKRLIGQGVDGIISNDLELLAALPEMAAASPRG
jgi:glycerophosphoryl diester phosphodiesterase